MPLSNNHVLTDWERITAATARVLCQFERQLSESQAATELRMSLNGVKSDGRDLRDITGCASVKELGKWWRENRVYWLAQMSSYAGIVDLPTAS